MTIVNKTNDVTSTLCSLFMSNILKRMILSSAILISFDRHIENYVEEDEKLGF